MKSKSVTVYTRWFGKVLLLEEIGIDSREKIFLLLFMKLLNEYKIIKFLAEMIVIVWKMDIRVYFSDFNKIASSK